MEFKTSYIFCSPKLIDPLDEVQEIYQVIRRVTWTPDKMTAVSRTGKEVSWQEAYNRLFKIEFEKIGGRAFHPVLCEKLKPRAISLRMKSLLRYNSETHPLSIGTITNFITI